MINNITLRIEENLFYCSGVKKENLTPVPLSPVSINNSPFKLDCTKLLISRSPNPLLDLETFLLSNPQPSSFTVTQE